MARFIYSLLLGVLLSLLTSSVPLQAQDLAESNSDAGSFADAQAAGVAQPSATSYRLLAGDEIAIRVFDEPDLSTSQRIDDNGSIIVPLLGNVSVKGLTLRECEQMLEQRFIDEEYLLQPQVTASISRYATRKFTVFGEVRSPGTKTLPVGESSINIVEALSLAGDFTEYAKRNQVRITRKDDQGRELTVEVDVDDFIKGNRNRPDQRQVLIYPNDVIFVPERGL